MHYSISVTGAIKEKRCRKLSEGVKLLPVNTPVDSAVTVKAAIQ